MTTLFHKYKEQDQVKICNFYKTLYNYDEKLYGNLKVMWECVLQSPSYPLFHHEESGIWEDKDRVVGMVHLSGPWLGEVNIDIHPNYLNLFEDMVSYAESKFTGTNREGKRYIRTNSVGLYEGADDILKKHHYEKCGEGKLIYKQVSSIMNQPHLPEGFSVTTLDKIYDFNKLSKLIWEALHYPGMPPEYDDDIYLPIKHAWLKYQKENCVVILGPDGEYAAFCGIWFDMDTKVAYIEPLIRDIRYQNYGLGYVCIYESLLICRRIGASKIFAQPNQESAILYCNAGFKRQMKQENWMKIWNLTERVQ